eukprot:COSAG05_NODE_7721_length_776_cov_1.333826_2_plen_119_part_01
MCIFFNTAKGWRSGTVTKHAISRVFLHGLHRTELHSRGCLLVLGTGFEASEIVGAFTECLATNLVTTLDITPTMAYDVRRKDSPELLDLGRVKKKIPIQNAQTSVFYSCTACSDREICR